MRDVSNRLDKIESTLAARQLSSEAASPETRAQCFMELMERRAIPLPPLDGVDIGATARLWAKDPQAEYRRFVAADGTERTAEALAATSK